MRSIASSCLLTVVCPLVAFATFSGCFAEIGAPLEPIFDAPSGLGTTFSPISCETDLLPRSGEGQRLNQVQLRNALRALFPPEIHAADLLPSLETGALPETHAGQQFSTEPTANVMQSTDLINLNATATAIAAEVYTAIEQRLSVALLPCEPTDDPTACAALFIDDFGTRAFRRPLFADEHHAAFCLFAHYHDETPSPEGCEVSHPPPDDNNSNMTFVVDSFAMAVSMVVSSLIQAPQFIHLSEIGVPTDFNNIRRLTPYEIAARMSFLFWNAPPDQLLWEAAEDSSLDQPDVRAWHVERLMADPRSRPILRGFVKEWFGIAGDISERVTDPSATLVDDWHQQVDRDIDRWLFATEGSPLHLLLTDSTTAVNQRLAAGDFYNLDFSPGADGWSNVDLGSAYAGGLLTRPLLAATLSPSSTETSIILRGLGVRQRLLCHTFGAPPDNAEALNAEITASDETVRGRMESRLGTQPCGSCHRYIDPVGIGMEDLNPYGILRTDVDRAGELDLDGSAQAFSGTAELAQTLAYSEEFRSCAVKQWLRYALGTTPSGIVGRCLQENLGESFEQANHNVLQLMRSIVNLDAFLFRKMEDPA